MSQIEKTEELSDEVGYLVYNETLMDHFMHPRNVGEIEHPDAMAEVGDPACGDFIRVYLMVEGEKISVFFLPKDVWSVSTSSIAQNWPSARLSRALKLTVNDVIKPLGAFPRKAAIPFGN
jgi:nitrogen fixation NifU-like protein